MRRPLLRLLLAAAVTCAWTLAAGSEPETQEQIVWQTSITSSPVSMSVFARPEGRSVLIVGFDDRIQGYDSVTGERLWTVEGYGANGLGSFHESQRAVGWAGPSPADQQPTFVEFSVDDGRILQVHPLTAPVIGPPRRLQPKAVQERLWFIPLGGGLVDIRSDDGRIAQRAGLAAALHPDLVEVSGLVAAWVGSESELVPVLGWSRRSTPRRINPSTVKADGSWLVAGSERSATAFRCRLSSSNRLKCRRRWTQQLAGGVGAPGVFLGDLVIVGSLDTHLYAFDRDSGHLRWRRSMGQRLTSPLEVIGGDAGHTTTLLILPEDSAEFSLVRAEDGALQGGVQGDARRELFLAPARTVRDEAGSRAFVAVMNLADQKVVLKAFDLESIKRPGPSDEGISEESSAGLRRGLFGRLAAQSGEESIFQRAVLVGGQI